MKRLLAGVGSLLNLCPTADYSRHIPTATPDERMRETWESVGRDMRGAVGAYEHGAKERARKR